MKIKPGDLVWAQYFNTPEDKFYGDYFQAKVLRVVNPYYRQLDDDESELSPSDLALAQRCAKRWTHGPESEAYQVERECAPEKTSKVWLARKEIKRIIHKGGEA